MIQPRRDRQHRRSSNTSLTGDRYTNSYMHDEDKFIALILNRWRRICISFDVHRAVIQHIGQFSMGLVFMHDYRSTTLILIYFFFSFSHYCSPDEGTNWWPHIPKQHRGHKLRLVIILFDYRVLTKSSDPFGAPPAPSFHLLFLQVNKTLDHSSITILTHAKKKFTECIQQNLSRMSRNHVTIDNRNIVILRKIKLH